MKSKRQKKPTKEEIDLQAAELLHYKKLQLIAKVDQRIKSRCDSLQHTPTRPTAESVPHAPPPASTGRAPASASKRAPPPTSAQQEPPAKRQSPDKVPVVAHAEPVPVAIRVARRAPTTTATYVRPRVPATLAQLYQRLDRQGLGLPNTPECPCYCCPFTTGPIMERRYHLMLALINAERFLYGV
jgi:hypothetical protein